MQMLPIQFKTTCGPREATMERLVLFTQLEDMQYLMHKNQTKQLFYLLR